MKKSSLFVSGVLGGVLMAMVVPMASAAEPIDGIRVRGLTAEVPAERLHRFVVKYKDGSSARLNATAAARGLNAAVQRAGLDRQMVATSGSAARSAVRATMLRRLGVPGWSVIKTSRHLTTAEARAFLRELKADPSVATAEIDELYQPMLVPNDPRYVQYQWNFHNAVGGVRAEAAWDVADGQGQGTVVAVIDTGIVQSHLDLKNNVIPGYDMITDPEVSRRPTADRIPGGWDVGDWREADYCGSGVPAEDSSWHGSHVAGTIAQETNNASGVAGLAHRASVMPIRVLGSCGGYLSDIADGITWASGGTVAGMPANTNVADVINMSLGSTAPRSCSSAYQDAINGANSRGTIIVVAAGNDNADAGTYTMGSCSGVIVVGATGITGAKASYSNWGTRVDLSAPGGGGSVDGNPNGYIWQITNGGTTVPTTTWYYTGMIGTSMASPHVAAAAAMVQGARVANGKAPLTWTEMRDLLKSSSRAFPVAPPAGRAIGAGILDVKAALDAALAEPCTENCGTPLQNHVPVGGNTGAQGAEVLYSFEATAGSPLRFMTYGGTGNVAVYVKYNAVPTVDSHDFTSNRAGNAEVIRIAQPKTGTYYIKLVGAGAFNNVTVQADQ